MADHMDAQYGFGFFGALRQWAPNVTILIDESAYGRSLFDEVHLRALSSVAETQKALLGDLEFPESSVVAGGPTTWGRWQLQVQDGEAPQLLLARVDKGVLYIVDSRLVYGFNQDFGNETQIANASRGREPSVSQWGLIDGLLLGVLLLTGWLLVPISDSSLMARAALAVPVGAGANAALGIARIPGFWAPLVALGVAVGIRFLRRGGTIQLAVMQRNGATFLLALYAVVGIALWSRAIGFIWFSTDSVQILSQGRLLADGNLTSDLIQIKRGLALQQLHAPGFALRIEGIQSLGLALLVSGTALVFALPTTLRWTSSRSSKIFPWVISTLAAFALIASPAVRFMAASAHPHLIVAVVLLALVVLLETHAPNGAPRQRLSVTLPAEILLLFALVLLRVEGPLLAALILIGALRRGRVSNVWHWRGLGIATLAWTAILVHGCLQRGEAVPLVVWGFSIAGTIFVVVPEVLRALPSRVVAAIPTAVGLTLWGVTAVLLLWDFDSIRFLDAAYSNISEGRGGWGATGPLLLIIGVAIVMLPERDTDRLGVLGARWALIGFVPVALITKLGDGLQSAGAGIETLLYGGGRPGWGDSVNRMWMHSVLILFALAVWRLSGERARW